MKKPIRFVGLDVHAETIAVAVAEPSGEVRSLGTIRNRPEAVRRMVRKLGPAAQLRICYEAGPCGYVLYWQLVGLDVHCDVVAPSLVPVKAGDRVLFTSWAGETFKVGDEELLLMKEDDILAILDD